MSRKEVYKHIYHTMRLIREFEEKVADLFSQGVMHGTCHLCVGEEAACAASVAALEVQDYRMSTHRGHGHALASGVSAAALMAEMFGRATGVCHGMGGSMHITDIEKNFLGTNGIVGGGIPIAAGAALTIKRKRIPDKISVCFFGDGATNEGVFYESLNMAALWKLPVLYICQNNQYAMSTHFTRNMAVPDIMGKARCFGIKTISVDGNDAAGVYNAVRRARKYVLENGPMLLIENTYRISGHSKSDCNAYRSDEEIELWKTRCPIERFGEFLIAKGFASPEELKAMGREAQEAVEAAVKFAQNSPFPTMEEVRALAGRQSRTRL